MIESKIKNLKKEIIKYAQRVEEMVEKSVYGFLEKNKEKLLSVIEEDEPVVNQKEIVIEKTCTNLIAIYQPEAKYLRLILMALKMNNDLERIGDLAVNIAQSGLALLENGTRPVKEIKQMADETIKMLKDSIKAFTQENSFLAKEVLKRDDKVDKLRNKIYSKALHMMKENPQNVEKSFHFIRIAHNLERIADLSTNTCEDVIYIVEGLIVKHSRF